MSIVQTLQARDYLLLLSKTLKKIDQNVVVSIANRVQSAKETGNTVFLMGNGGSASTSSHGANDLMKMGGVKAISIPDLVPAMLAYGNDEGWETMFLHPLDKLSRDGDLVIAISCSGNSKNVVNVVKKAPKGVDFVALTGEKGGELSKLVGVSLKVPCDDIRIQEDVHLAILHSIAGMI